MHRNVDMKRLFITIILTVIVLSAASVCDEQGTVRDPEIKSGKPGWIKIALNRDASKIVSLLLDESQGTDKGYDIMYAGTESGGTLKDAKKLNASTRKKSSYFYSYFPHLNLKVFLDEKGKDQNKDEGKAENSESKNNCALKFTYVKYFKNNREKYRIKGTLKLQQGSKLFKYSIYGRPKPASKPEDAPVWNFLCTPKISVKTKINRPKQGSVGIGIYMTCGNASVQCDNSVKAHVIIKDEDEKTVHDDTAALNKFEFG